MYGGCKLLASCFRDRSITSHTIPPGTNYSSLCCSYESSVTWVFSATNGWIRRVKSDPKPKLSLESDDREQGRIDREEQIESPWHVDRMSYELWLTFFDPVLTRLSLVVWACKVMISVATTTLSKAGPLSMCLQSVPLLPSFDAALTPVLAASAYMFLSNTFYLARRAKLRRVSMLEILRLRTEREPGLSLFMFVMCLLAWQTIVMIFPVTEPLARSFGFTSFFNSYPNANGGGYIFERLASPGKKRTREQVRLDWHKFNFNVGKIGRDGYRHPPTIERNLPHIDVPQKGIKHWPWRRRHVTERNTRQSTAGWLVCDLDVACRIATRHYTVPVCYDIGRDLESANQLSWSVLYYE